MRNGSGAAGRAPRGRVSRRAANRGCPATAWRTVARIRSSSRPGISSTAPVRWERRAQSVELIGVRRPQRRSTGRSIRSSAPASSAAIWPPTRTRRARPARSWCACLNGTPPTAIPRSSFVNVPVVDWRALRRWGIDESLLPANADVRFREPTRVGQILARDFRRDRDPGLAGRADCCPALRAPIAPSDGKCAGRKPEAHESGGARRAALPLELGRGPRPALGDQLSAG